MTTKWKVPCPSQGCRGTVEVTPGPVEEAGPSWMIDKRDCDHDLVAITRWDGSPELVTREEFDKEVTQETIEEEYHAAAAEVDGLLRALPLEHIRNLLQQYLVGVFDVGIYESLSPEQVKGVTFWLKDLIETSKHLDLTKPCEPGAYPEWEPAQPEDYVKKAIETYRLREDMRGRCLADMMRVLESYG